MKRASIGLAIATLLISSTSWAGPTAAENLARGLELYEAGDYEAAATAFEASYRADRNADALFAWAQAERLSGDCAAAIPLYRRVLTRPLAADQGRVVRDALAKCGVSGSAEGQTDAGPPGEAAPPDPADADDGIPIEEPTGSDRPEQRSLKPIVLFAAGGAGLAMGTGFWIAARSEAKRAEEPGILYDDYRKHRDLAIVRQRIAIASAVVGTVALAGGVWFLARDERPARAATLSGWTADGGGGLVVSGRF